MKKTILLLAGSLALGAVTTQAQQRDSTRSGNGQRQQMDQARGKNQSANSTYNAGDVEIIQNGNVPASLKQALDSDDKYAGWENAIIYHNKKTGEYLVSPRAHRFDKDGNPIDYPGEKSTHKSMRKTKSSATGAVTEPQGSQQRERSTYGNDQSGKQRTGTSDATATGKQYSSTAAASMGQDTSSQAMSATDQGRQASTSGRMQQDSSSETASQGQYGNQQGQDRRKQSNQSNAYRTERSTTSGDVNNNNTEMSMEGLVEVQQSEVPVSLKETLADDQYKGWETGKLYRHESTGEYVLVMDEKTAGEGKQTYRFDKDGKLMNGSSHKDH